MDLIIFLTQTVINKIIRLLEFVAGSN